MTDQIPAGLTRDQAQAVREWAERSYAAEVQDETMYHVARVLLAVLPPPPTTAKENPELPDQTLEDQVRPIVAAMRAAMRRDEHAYPEAKFLADLSGYIKDLEALLAQRPTLADMTDEERAACQWMQADIIGGDEPLVIARIDRNDGAALILDRNGRSDWSFAEDVTPRPDLPRMEWPGTEKPAPAPALPWGWRLAEHPRYGRVIVTTPEPDLGGRVALVRHADYHNSGHVSDWCDPAALTFLDQEADQ